MTNIMSDTRDILVERLADYNKSQRTASKAETDYWLNQYKAIAIDSLVAWKKATAQQDKTIAELNAKLESLIQAITDPENQPSQYGTVPLYWYENLENKLERIRFNVGKVIDSLDGSYENHTIRKALQEAID